VWVEFVCHSYLSGTIARWCVITRCAESDRSEERLQAKETTYMCMTSLNAPVQASGDPMRAKNVE
jgi:hypothetical protein